MQTNSISFGSTFKFNTDRLKRVKRATKRGIIKALETYAGVSESQSTNLFKGYTSVLTVGDANDKVIEGFFKTIGLQPENISKKIVKKTASAKK